MKIGILGGSYNPVHVGHTMLASYLAQWGGLDAVWLVLSPQNPLKDSTELIEDSLRLGMLRCAVTDCKYLDVSDIELSMPRPSYTIDTLRALKSRFPGDEFTLIMGSDNWLIIDKWRDYQSIINEFGVMVYPRPGFDVDTALLPEGVRVVDAPVCSLSSTMVREALSAGKDVEFFLPSGVYDFIKRHKLYNCRRNEYGE